jgi:hypothetical protein
MYSRGTRLTLAAVAAALTIPVIAAQQAQPPAPGPIIQGQLPADDVVRTLVGQLELERYKATIKGLTQFGDRREGTERNRRAVDWIEAQLKSYGCETGRMSYDPNMPREGQQAGRGGRGGAGGKGFGGPTGVNNDPMRQPDEKLRELNMGPVIPGDVDQVYCTKWGTTRRGEMYIVGAYMDGIGYGEAANDDGSGTAIVMELVRILNAPGVVTDVSIRFALWNGEEGGRKGARAYVAQRAKLQGTPDEPRWLGKIQHDMMMFDHGMPGPDGKVSPDQRREADVNIEFQINSKMAAESQKLAWFFKDANARYATDYPATVGPHMQSTDSVPFQDLVAAISLRENERRDHIGFGWNPHWHQPTDVFSTLSDADFRLGLNAAQTTLAAIAQLAGAGMEKR